jgi:flagellar motility protein MotE (MotC chaperone)
LAFNIDGVKDAFINKFYTNKLERFQDEVNRDNENLFAQQQAQLDEKRKELEELEIELNARKSELELRELELQQLQEELNANKSEADSKNANIQSVVSTFENMDSDDAAKILMQYQNMNEVVQIVKNLSSSKMAEILSEMTPSFAANILQLMNN